MAAHDSVVIDKAASEAIQHTKLFVPNPSATDTSQHVLFPYFPQVVLPSDDAH